MLAIVSILGGIRIQIRYFIKRIQNTSAYTYQYLYCKCPSDKKIGISLERTKSAQWALQGSSIAIQSNTIK